MYPVSYAFLTAVKANTRKYYWTGKITTTAGTVYNFDQEDMVKGSGYITSQCCGSTGVELGTVYTAEIGIFEVSEANRKAKCLEIEAMPNGSEKLFIYSDNDIETYRDILFYVGRSYIASMQAIPLQSKGTGFRYAEIRADDYMVVDRMHEAVISRELREATRLRRKDTGVKWDTTESIRICMTGWIFCTTGYQRWRT